MSEEGLIEFRNLFELQSGSLKVMECKVLSGIVKAGLSVNILLDGGLHWAIKIDGVGAVDHAESESTTGLRLMINIDEEWELLKSLTELGDHIKVENCVD